MKSREVLALEAAEAALIAIGARDLFCSTIREIRDEFHRVDTTDWRAVDASREPVGGYSTSPDAEAHRRARKRSA